MGTNYYLYNKAPCPTCGHSDGPLHIGKSSGGWCFGLHVIPEDGINDLPDWERLWSTSGAYIKNEDGDLVSAESMKEIITGRSWPRMDKTFNYASNHAERGPNNLARHIVDGRHCLGHGAGTWDLIAGEFC